MPQPRYSGVARALHWVIAVLAIGQIALGLAADAAAKPLSTSLLQQHVRIGLLILALMILRVLWRLSHRPPSLPVGMPRAQRLVARATHLLLYLLLIVMPISGYILWAWIGRPLDWFGLFPIPILFTGGDDEFWRSFAGYVHEYGFFALAALIALHVAGALWHEVVRGDRLVRDRML